MNEEIPQADHERAYTPDIKPKTANMLNKAYKEYARRKGWLTGQEASRRAYSGQSFYGTKGDKPE